MYFCSFISDLCCRIDFVQAFYTALWGSTWSVPAQTHIQENPGKQSLRTSLKCNRCCEYSLQLLLSPSIKEVLWDSKEARSIDCTDSLMSFAMAGFKQPCNSPCWRGILWDKLAQLKRLYSVIREGQVIFTYYMHTQHRMYYLTNTSRWQRMNVSNSCDHVIVYIDIETWLVVFFPRFLGSEEAIFSDYP